MTTKIEVTDRVLRGENWEDRTQNFNVLVPGRRASGLAKLEKLQGTRVFLEGQLVYGKDSLFLEAREVILCGKKKEQSNSQPVADDEIPF